MNLLHFFREREREGEKSSVAAPRPRVQSRRIERDFHVGGKKHSRYRMKMVEIRDKESPYGASLVPFRHLLE